MHSDSNDSLAHWLQQQSIAFHMGESLIINANTKATVYTIENNIRISLLEFYETQNPYNSFVSIPNGIRLWQDQWVHQKPIVTGRILSLLGKSTPIYARKTVVKKINQDEADRFLNGNHLQGSTKAKIKYGIYHKEHLVSVATFTWPRKFYKEDRIHLSFGLIRHCNLNGHHVIGGLSKILAQLQKDYAVDDIMTFVDLDWSEGTSYQQLGFELIERTEPETFYIDRNTLKRYYPHEVAKLGKSIDQYIEIQNSGNNKYKLFINSMIK